MIRPGLSGFRELRTGSLQVAQVTGHEQAPLAHTFLHRGLLGA